MASKRNSDSKGNKKNASSTKNTNRLESPETETQSQSQNRRTSRGRTHNGSDGTSNAGRGSNH